MAALRNARGAAIFHGSVQNPDAVSTRRGVLPLPDSISAGEAHLETGRSVKQDAASVRGRQEEQTTWCTEPRPGALPG
jgi:hypothetical protein